jgi:hypothetical protein
MTGRRTSSVCARVRGRKKRKIDHANCVGGLVRMTA